MAWSCIKEGAGFGHEPFGQEPLGGGDWCIPLEGAHLEDVEEPTDNFVFIRAIDFPLQFKSDGDVVLTKDEGSVNDDLKTSVFVRRHGIPLFPFGAGIEELVFDPLDFATEVFVSDRISTSVHQGNRHLRVLEEEITYTEDEESKLSAAVPYINTKTGRGASALLSIPKQRTDQ